MKYAICIVSLVKWISTSLTKPRRLPSLLIERYLPVAVLINLMRLGPNDCISNNTENNTKQRTTLNLIIHKMSIQRIRSSERRKNWNIFNPPPPHLPSEKNCDWQFFFPDVEPYYANDMKQVRSADD